MRRIFMGAAGAALVYFLDPDQGARRRSMARDRVAALVRRGWRRGETAGRYAASEAQGVVERARHPQSSQEPPPDDNTLARKVETEIFRPEDVPKGSVNVNAVDGVVSLRGEVDDPDMIRRLEEETRKIPGVVDVENLLHPPGTPAPTTTTPPNL